MEFVPDSLELYVNIRGRYVTGVRSNIKHLVEDRTRVTM